MKSTELKIGRVNFGAGCTFRTLNLGVQISKHSAEINLGFFFLYLDWYDYGKMDWFWELDEDDFIDG